MRRRSAVPKRRVAGLRRRRADLVCPQCACGSAGTLELLQQRWSARLVIFSELRKPSSFGRVDFPPNTLHASLPSRVCAFACVCPTRVLSDVLAALDG